MNDNCQSVPTSVAVWVGLIVFIVSMVGMLALLFLCIYGAWRGD